MAKKKEITPAKVVSVVGCGHRFGVLPVKRGCVVRYYGGLLAPNGREAYSKICVKACLFPSPELAEQHAVRLASFSSK